MSSLMVNAAPFEFFASRKIERALLSVSDKAGLVEFARALAEPDFKELLLTDPAKALANLDLSPDEVMSLKSLSLVAWSTLATAKRRSAMRRRTLF